MVSMSSLIWSADCNRACLLTLELSVLSAAAMAMSVVHMVEAMTESLLDTLGDMHAPTAACSPAFHFKLDFVFHHVMCTMMQSFFQMRCCLPCSACKMELCGCKVLPVGPTGCF